MHPKLNAKCERAVADAYNALANHLKTELREKHPQKRDLQAGIFKKEILKQKKKHHLDAIELWKSA